MLLYEIQGFENLGDPELNLTRSLNFKCEGAI